MNVISSIETTKYTLERNLPSQLSSPEQEITVDVAAKEDVVVGKSDGVEIAELVMVKEDAEKKIEKIGN